MNFKEYERKDISFIFVSAPSQMKNYLQPLFEFNGEYYHTEKFAIEYFKSKGYGAFFCENEVWIKLFVYLLNDELKRTPNHKPDIKNINDYLYDDEFFKDNEKKITERFNNLKNVNLADEMRNNLPEYDYKVIEICNRFENDQILQVLFHLVQNFNARKRGFPDLFVFNEHESFFSEIKAKSDSLSYVQVKKHEVLLKAGIPVVLFAINKRKSWQNRVEDRYFNDAVFRRGNLIDMYDSKIYAANMVYNQLLDENIEEFKKDFLSHHDFDTFLGFLVTIEELPFNQKVKSINSPSEILIEDSIEMGLKLKRLRILKEGRILENKKKYLDAINEYSKVDSFKSYKRIIYCYRALNDYENELNYIYNGINNSNFKKKDIGFFKRRLKRFFKNKNHYTKIKTSKTCPYCGSSVVLNVFKSRNKIKFFTCENEKCYWYGGVYKGNINEIHNL